MLKLPLLEGFTALKLAIVQEDLMTKTGVTKYPQDFDRPYRQTEWTLGLFLRVLACLFWMRVVVVSSELYYRSLGMQGLIYVVTGSIVLFGASAAIRAAEPSWQDGGPRIDMFLGKPGFLLLGIVALFGVCSRGKSSLILQIFPLQVALYVSGLFGAIPLALFVVETIKRKINSGSIFPSNAELDVCKIPISSVQNMSAPRRMMHALSPLINAVLWTTLLVFQHFCRHILYLNSLWTLIAFAYLGAIWWISSILSMHAVVRLRRVAHI